MVLGLVSCAQDTHQPVNFGFKQNVRVKSGFYKGLEGKVVGTWESLGNPCLSGFGCDNITVYRVFMYDNVLHELTFRQDDLEAI